MGNTRVVILGSTGMLGSMILKIFAAGNEFDIIATYRDSKIGKLFKNQYPKVDFRHLDAQKANLKTIKDVLKGAEWIVNAIGITKPYIHDDNQAEVAKAIYVNSYFPNLLTSAAGHIGSKIIQIATDCVYSGQKGQYIESDYHDALDVYGKTKSLGEVYGVMVYHLRCSIIGPQLKEPDFLMAWLLRQPKNAMVNGFTNHKWNGITTLHFARICRGIIKEGVDLPHIQHIIPGNVMSKANLLKSIAEEFKRDDIIVKSVQAPVAINRTLSTENAKLNKKLWRLAGYASPPAIEKMIKELSQYQFSRKNINQ